MTAYEKNEGKTIMEPEPKILYKYRSLSGDSFKFTHDIFMKNGLYFPHPDQLNDPFDCNLIPYLKDLTKEQAMNYLNACDSKKWESKGMDLNKFKEYIMGKPISYLQEYLETNPFKAIRNVGVLSFSERRKDILMWGHYADSHSGICIGFDYYKLLFDFREKPTPPEQVKYPRVKEFPKWNPFVDDKVSQVNKYYLTKAIDWDYEKEWRVILPEKGRSVQKINPDSIV